MELLKALEQHLSLPDDSETIRKQKVVAMVAGITGLISATGLTIINLAIRLDSVAWLYGLTALFMCLVVVAYYLWPRYYIRWVFFTAVFVTINPWAAHLATGGFRSGLYPANWSLFGPFAAVILIGPRRALAIIALLIVTAVTAGFLEPYVSDLVPDLNDPLRVSIGLFNLIMPALMIFISGLYLFRALELEQNRADALLLNILPRQIARRLKQDNSTIAEYHETITVLFADIVDFTRLSSSADPAEVVGVLNAVFSDFDDLADHYQLEKIKTIGDAYMVVGGLPNSQLNHVNHVQAVMSFAIDILQSARAHQAWNGEPIYLRVGIHTGPAVGGVIGHRKFIYDLWGDTVNTASRMEAYGLTNTIQVTAAVKEKLADQYCFEARGPIDIKGKGAMMTYLLRLDERGHPLIPASDPSGQVAG
jgi:adenylate cyclase